MQAKYRNANGDLTSYALNNGYIQRKLDGPVEVELFLEHGSYHVRGFDADSHKRLFWEATSNLIQARALYRHGAQLALTS